MRQRPCRCGTGSLGFFVFVLETIRTGAMRVVHIPVKTEETQRLRIKFVLYCPMCAFNLEIKRADFCRKQNCLIFNAQSQGLTLAVTELGPTDLGPDRVRPDRLRPGSRLTFHVENRPLLQSLTPKPAHTKDALSPYTARHQQSTTS